MIVTCSQCSSFFPSPYEPTQGLGMCGELVAYMRKLGRKIRSTEHAQVMNAIGNRGGNKLTYPLVERNCSKFTVKP